MEIKLYILLLVYFLLGGISMFFVNRNKDAGYRKNNWLKYVVYFVLVNMLFVSILINSRYFHYISILILVLGYYEIFTQMHSSGNTKAGIVAITLFSLFAFTSYHFSLLPKNFLFYTLYLTTAFDAFSQLTGQLFGKRKLLSKISPNKTVEGLIGGIVLSLFTSLLIRNLLGISILTSVFLGLGLAAFAFLGDILASCCKRKFNSKDFSNLIPGHGGVLDRFDSLISAGSFMFLINLFTEI